MTLVDAWCFLTPLIKMKKKKDERAFVDAIIEQDGFVGAHIDEQGRGIAWMFKSKNDAIIARNVIVLKFNVFLYDEIIQVRYDEEEPRKDNGKAN